jgi:hypothetical protein
MYTNIPTEELIRMLDNNLKLPVMTAGKELRFMQDSSQTQLFLLS